MVSYNIKYKSFVSKYKKIKEINQLTCVAAIAS